MMRRRRFQTLVLMAPIVFMGAVVLPWLVWQHVEIREARAEIRAQRARDAARELKHDKDLAEVLKGLIEIQNNLDAVPKKDGG